MGVILSRLFWQVLNMSITAGWCIAAILILRVLFRKMPRKYLYALWLVAAFRLICPVSVSTDVSVFNLEHLPGNVLMEEVQQMNLLPDVHNMMSEAGRTDEENHTSDSQQKEETTVSAGYSFPKIPLRGMLYREERIQFLLGAGPYIWAAGILLFALYFVVSTWRLQRKVRMAVLVQEPESSCPVYECDSQISPFAAGIFFPRIYLPCYLKGRQRQMVLLHEQYHIARRDHLVKLLSFSLLAVYWFHPLVWAAWFSMCKDMEMSCDEKVLEQLGEEYRKEYGMTLLACAVDGHPDNWMPLAFGEQDVESRIKHVLNFRKPVVWVGIGFVVVFAAVMLLLGTNGTHTGESGQGAAGREEAEAADGPAAEEKTGAGLLYEARNLYIGNAPADGNLSRTIGSVLKDSAFAKYAYTMELQTSEEPYEYCYILSDVLPEQPSFWEMAASATLMLALTDNMGAAKWKYRVMLDGEETSVFCLWDLKDAAEWCQVDDVKAYAESPEKVQELLGILEELRQTDTRLDADRIMEEMPRTDGLKGEVTEDGRDETLQQ